MSLSAIVLLALAAEVPVLLDPAGARAEALAAPVPAGVTEGLQRAEVLRLARDLAAARAALEAVGPTTDPAVAARAEALALDVAVDARDPARVEAAARALEARPGWRAHAWRQRAAAERDRSGAWWGLFGSITFSLALAVTMIGGARELLVPRGPVWALAALAVAVVAATALVSPLLARVVGLADLAIVTLCHAAHATLRRNDPGPRFRVFLAVVVVVGAAGALIAVFSPLPWSFVLDAL